MTRLFRRVVVAPGVILLTFVLLTTIPVWVLAAAAASPVVPGRLRPLRLLAVLLVHLVLESLMLVELFGLWIASGFGLWIRRPFFQRIHYDIVRAYLAVMFPRGAMGAAPRDHYPGAHSRRLPRASADRVLPARRPWRLLHPRPRPDELVRP